MPEGRDAIISLPPANQSDPAAILEYYQQVGSAHRPSIVLPGGG
jgi:hypothetical protein